MADVPKDPAAAPEAAAGNEPPAPPAAPAADPGAPPPEPPAAGDPPAAPPAPDPYASLALPTDTVLDETSLERVRTLAGKHKLDPAVVQEVIEAMHHEVADILGVIQDGVKEDGTIWKARVEAFTKAALEDPALGNNSARKLEEVQLKTHLYLNQYAPELKALLAKEGLLTHPDFMKYALDRIKERGEDKLVTGTSAPAPTRPAGLRDRYNADGTPVEPVTQLVAP